MKNKVLIALIIIVIIVIAIVIFNKVNNIPDEIIYSENEGESRIIETSTEIKKLENGLSYVRYDGDYKFEQFLNQGGAESDSDVVKFLMNNLDLGKVNLDFDNIKFGCSTVQAQNEKGEYLFGRNFDWYNCDGLILLSTPSQGYSSISTVNMNFVTNASKMINALPDNTKSMVALYAPLDGMNEKGFCISTNMIEDSETINQNTSKPDITTTTAVRLLLNKAATVDEAIEILRQYDLHASFGYMVHFAMADSTGKSVVVEYINNEISVVETKVVTNFYLTQGNKYGIGTKQSMERYEILQKALQDNRTMNKEQVRDNLKSVCKANYHDGETTEWSIVFNQNTLEADYYHRENYNKVYSFKIDK